MKLRAVFFVSSAAWLLACGDDTAAPTVTTPGPASIVIASLHPLGNTTWNAPLAADPGFEDEARPGDPQPIELDCDGGLGVSVNLRGRDATETVNWTFRPRGGCGSSPNCGYLRIDLDPVNPLTLTDVDTCDNRSGTDVSDGSDGSTPTQTSSSCRSGAASTLAFDLSAQRETLAGPHLIRAALYRDSRTPARDREGEPLTVDLAVELVTPACVPAGEGGAGGAGAAGGAGGSSGTPEAGGEGGAG